MAVASPIVSDHPTTARQHTLAPTNKSIDRSSESICQTNALAKTMAAVTPMNPKKGAEAGHFSICTVASAMAPAAPLPWERRVLSCVVMIT